jgi:hypothetical protein
MNERGPRYIATFRARTPEMIVVGALTFFGAVFLVLAAQAFRALDCGAEGSSECSTAGLVQLVVAVTGVAPAALTLAASLRERGRPWRWFLATVAWYSGWLLVVASWNS